MTGRPGSAVHDGSLGCPRDSRLLAWGVVGVIAQAAFMAGWLIAETWQGPGYSPVKDTISDLQAATASHVWFPVACFAAGGVGTFGFAVFGLRPALAAAGQAAPYAPWMLACSALALGNSFPLIPCRLADPGCTAHHQLASPGGLTDAIIASIAFLVLAVTPFPLWRRLKELPRWQRHKPVMMTARVAGPVCYLLLGITSNAGIAEGLAERILATTCVLWMCALAVTLISVSRPAPVNLASATG
ncbi:MAG: DUF998 domain-containing protein [Streptosporangiaceae bacterium]